MVLLRVRKDVILLRENRDVAIVKLRKVVTLLGKMRHDFTEGA